MRRRSSVLVGVSLALGFAACGDSGGGGAATTTPPVTTSAASEATTPATTTTTTTTTATTPAAASASVTITMSDYAFAPKDAVANAGRVTISAPNAGQRPHELVLLRTKADPAHLPKRNGEVDESKSVGEIADVAAGKTKNHTFHLTPGRYVMVCNLPGHYASGMYGTLTVR
jgi:uncharacterized cupredoxin-like copper-binding protein